MAVNFTTLGIATCSISYGKESSFAGVLATVGIQVTAKAIGVSSLRLTWAATGDVFSSFIDSTSGDAGAPGIIVLPQTGQPGFKHGTSTFQDWYYEAVVTAQLADGQVLNRTYRFQIPAGQTTLDLDTLDEDTTVTAQPAVGQFSAEPAGLSSQTLAALSATYVHFDGTNLTQDGNVVSAGGVTATDNGVGGITTTSAGAADNGLGGIAA